MTIPMLQLLLVILLSMTVVQVWRKKRACVVRVEAGRKRLARGR